MMEVEDDRSYALPKSTRSVVETHASLWPEIRVGTKPRVDPSGTTSLIRPITAMLSVADHPEIDRLARELAAETGDTPFDALRVALLERLKQVRRNAARSARRKRDRAMQRSLAEGERASHIPATGADELTGVPEVVYFGNPHPEPEAMLEAITLIQMQVAKRPVADNRPLDELLDYDEDGIPS